MKDVERTAPEEQTPGGAPDRPAERGDAAEPDAPTSGEENGGLSTVLSADPLVGVQPDEGDE